jgi:hypothetical protein
MKTSAICSALLAMALFFSATAARPQAASTNGLPLSEFKSPDPRHRAEAYYAIKDNQEALRQPLVQESLFNLQDRENHDDGKGPGHGEGYSAYLSDLLDTILVFTDWDSTHEVCILANSNYGAPSDFGLELVTKAGQKAVPCLLQRAQGDDGNRSIAIEELLQISVVSKDLPTTMRDQIRDVVIGGLQDSDSGTRLSTVNAAGRFATIDLVPVIQDLAHSDPYFLPGTNPPAYFVRDAATKAIRSIQERAKTR